MSRSNRTVDAESLRGLGFTEDLIEDARILQERGALAIEPPAGLVQHTIEKCAHLFPKEAGETKQAKGPEWELFYQALGLGNSREAFGELSLRQLFLGIREAQVGEHISAA